MAHCEMKNVCSLFWYCNLLSLMFLDFRGYVLVLVINAVMGAKVEGIIGLI